MLFSTNPQDIAIERMMTGVPHFPPRGHGLYIFNRFKYTAKDCDCRLCPHYDRKKKCKLPKCECIEERIEAAAVGYKEFMKHTLSPVTHRIFQSRLNEYLKESEDHPMLYRGNAHKEMFNAAIERSLNSDNAILSALYLLTADKYLWSKVRRAVGSSSIDFHSVHLGDVSSDAYTLYMTARDLYEGTKHITVSDIADRNIVSHKMFGVLVNAMAIRRYGMNAVQIIGKGGDSK